VKDFEKVYLLLSYYALSFCAVYTFWVTWCERVLRTSPRRSSQPVGNRNALTEIAWKDAIQSHTRTTDKANLYKELTFKLHRTANEYAAEFSLSIQITKGQSLFILRDLLKA